MSDDTPTPPHDNAPQKDWKSATDQEILDTDLIIALGLETLSDDDKIALMEEMTLTIQQAVAGRMYDSLTEEQRKEMETVMDQNDPEKTTQYLMEQVPDFPAIVQAETVKYKRAMLTGEIPGAA